MPNKSNGRAIKVKVKPYPFSGELEQAGAKSSINILYVSTLGFVAGLGSQFVKVGDRYMVSFVLPTFDQSIMCSVRVVKTYDRSLENSAQKVERMGEFHFEKLTDEHKARIVSFMAAIGQTK